MNNIYKNIWQSFSLEEKSLDELMKISSIIDLEKTQSDVIVPDEDDLAVIASVVIALINQKSTSFVGKTFYENINKLIVDKNLDSASEKCTSFISQDYGTYKIIKTNSGYLFTLKSYRGETLVVSNIYKTFDTCISGIENFRKVSNSVTDDTTIKENNVPNPKYEIYIDKAGEYRFRLKAGNGEIMAVSEGYLTKIACQNVIEMIKKYALTDFVEKS